MALVAIRDRQNLSRKQVLILMLVFWQTSGTFIEHSPSSLLTGHRSGIQLQEIATA
ncbi:hypothetical protein [Tychonema sp. LEGE 07203]|uniref:hypothetical protein n=1 Tax=Tychonema sp. LEGE 07203 TaxID=1828671 RepID=UPI001882751F|nr:hypothetical protein [Tychonema sp. LEGE 07203]MBE9096640.1 hypothetical protein [Tychonema sp. LEGE 07203]